MITHAVQLAGLASILVGNAGPQPPPIPDPSSSIVTPVVVGSSSGIAFPTADPADETGFQLYVRGVGFAPVFRPNVVLDFSGAGGTRLYATTPGATVNCAARTVSGIGSDAGRIAFGIRIGGHNETNVVVVKANLVTLAFCPVRSTDIDGLGGRTDTSDLNEFRLRLFSGVQDPAVDFDLNGKTDVADLNLFREDLFSGVLDTYCP